LLEIYKIYDNLSTRSQIKISDIEKLNIDEALLQKYAGKQTAKLYKDIDMIGLISDMVKNIPDKMLSIKEQLKAEVEYLGSPITTYKTAPKDFYAVVDYKTYSDKLKPYCTLYSVKSGEMIKTKIKDKNFFALAPFELYDLIKVVKWKTQKKTQLVGGEWKKTDEDELILNEWEVY
jgi:hypothetical protein